MKKDRSKTIEAAIKIASSSLLSHLPFTYGKQSSRRESASFHKKCVREYCELIKHLSDLY